MRANDSSSAFASTFAQANEEISRAVGRMRGAVLSSAVNAATELTGRCATWKGLSGTELYGAFWPLPASNGKGSRRCSCCLPISLRTNPRRWTTA